MTKHHVVAKAQKKHRRNREREEARLATIKRDHTQRLEAAVKRADEVIEEANKELFGNEDENLSAEQLRLRAVKRAKERELKKLKEETNASSSNKQH